MNITKIKLVAIWLQENSTPIKRGNVECYTKGSMYCIFNREENYVEKFPVKNIFKVVEYY